MQKNNLAKSLISALVLASPLASAGNYPPPFEPSVIYRDADYISKQSQAAPAPAAAPAVPAKADTTKYPSEFKAEVLYRDAEAISKVTGSAALAGGSSAARSEPESLAASGKEAQPSGALSENLPLLGIVLGLAAVVLVISKRGAKAGTARPAAQAAPAVAAPAPSTGDTGVSRYLKSIGAGPETGVAKYLKELSATAATAVAAAAETGVARYLKSLPATASAAGTGADDTGVAKYLKKMESSS